MDKEMLRLDFAEEMKERIEEIRKIVENFCNDYDMGITIETYRSDNGVSILANISI